MQRGDVRAYENGQDGVSPERASSRVDMLMVFLQFPFHLEISQWAAGITSGWEWHSSFGLPEDEAARSTCHEDSALQSLGPPGTLSIETLNLTTGRRQRTASCLRSRGRAQQHKLRQHLWLSLSHRTSVPGTT